jgi:hydrogenase-4 component E
MTMTPGTFAQLVGLCAAVLLLTGVLMVWRRSLVAEVRLLAVQGAALGGLVAAIGVHEGSAELIAVALLVVLLKVLVLPEVLRRTVAADATNARESEPLVNVTASLILASLLTMLAYLVSRPLLALGDSPAVAAVPVGFSLVLFGFLVLATRRHAVSQLVGFLMLDNGIAAVAFLTTGGVPLVVELGVSLDVLLVVLILQVLTSRIRSEFGGSDLDDLDELRD